MICVDTNILIYAHRKGTAEHSAAQSAIEMAVAHAEGWGFAWPTVTEFWAQVTHPRYPGGASTPTQAKGFLHALMESGGASIFPVPGSSFTPRFLAVAVELKVCGARIFDLQIGLAALHAGAKRLWTHDAGFVAVPGLRIEDPLA